MKKSKLIILSLTMMLVMASWLFVSPVRTELDAWGDEITATDSAGFDAFKNVKMGDRDLPRPYNLVKIAWVSLLILSCSSLITLLVGTYIWIKNRKDTQKSRVGKIMLLVSSIGIGIVVLAFLYSLITHIV